MNACMMSLLLSKRNLFLFFLGKIQCDGARHTSFPRRAQARWAEESRALQLSLDYSPARPQAVAALEGKNMRRWILSCCVYFYVS